jgi:hypothetical protein
MMYLGTSSVSIWLYVYMIRYKRMPDVIDLNTWRDILQIFKLPPEFNQENKQIIIARIPNKILSYTTKKELGNINLKTEFNKNIDYKDIILITEAETKQKKEDITNFLHKHKTWIKPLEENPSELTRLYAILRKVFTHEAYEWLMFNYKESPLRIKEELSWWSYKFNKTKVLIDINQVRQDLGEFEENTERYCSYLAQPKGNTILHNMKSSDIWSTFFSINMYKSPVDIFIQRNCPALSLSLNLLHYSVTNGYVGIKEGTIILNSWWVNVVTNRKTKPWALKQNSDSLNELRRALKLILK